MEREREKERIRIGKELLEAKRIEEENERKRLLALRKAEKEEEQRAREKIRQKLEEDKVLNFSAHYYNNIVLRVRIVVLTYDRAL